MKQSIRFHESDFLIVNAMNRRCLSYRTLGLALVLLGALVPCASASDFDRTVAPILATCLDCHSGPDAKGGYDLSRKSSAMTNIVPGKPAESELWRKVRDLEMPPKKPLTDPEKTILKDWILGGATWGRDPIDPLAYSTRTHAGRDWWSLTPVRRPAVPPGPTSATHPIDAFLLARLTESKLTLSPPSDRRTLLRRLKFDLIGLPPTPEEVADFVGDRSPDAYEKRVEQYLASPQFGERWARHWLDVVRFAESHGFETNTVRANAWPYRDWVIKAFNDDMPYHRFVLEQLAGDTVGADAATGFLVAGPWDAVKSPDPVLTANQRADELHDLVATVGSTFLGLTVGCARCHNHKFDPIPQLDYYRIKAAFAGVQHGEREMKTEQTADRLRQRESARRELAAAEERLMKMEPLADSGSLEPRRGPVHPRRNIERFAPVKARFVRMVITATSNLEPCIDEFEIYSTTDTPKNVALASSGTKVTSSGDYSASPDIHRLAFVHDGRYGNGRSWISNTVGRGRLVFELPEEVEIDRIVWGRDRDEKFKDRLATRYRIDVSRDGKTWQVVASSEDRAAPGAMLLPPPGLNLAGKVEWLALTGQVAELRKRITSLEKADVAYLGRFTVPETVHRLHRGDPMAKRDIVTPGGLSEVAPAFTIPVNATDAERRVAIARWITDPANPLTSRVIVNRLWQHHFGTGIVSTPSDFGFNGGRPSHPELLDWLAAELTRKNGSLKHIHRLIVTSAAYRQSSVGHSEGLSKDAGSRLLWRYPPRRLEAEALRDSILFVSGQLNPTPGGPGFDLFEPNTNYVKVYTPKAVFGPAEFRRMIYQQKPRMQLDDTFGAFDCPDAGQTAPQRNSSTTPLQTLNLLNSPFLLQQSGAFAERVKTSAKEPPDQVRLAFRLAFQREPSETELSAAVKLSAQHGLAAVCRALLNANEFLYVD